MLTRKFATLDLTFGCTIIHGDIYIIQEEAEVGLGEKLSCGRGILVGTAERSGGGGRLGRVVKGAMLG